MTRSSPRAASAASPLSVDLTFSLDTALGAGRGIAAAAMGAARGRAAETLARTQAERAGSLGFHDLPTRADLAAPVTRWAAAARRRATDVLLVGIGGSSRGAEVLAGTLPTRGRGVKGRPRLHVLDTVDPTRAADLLATLRPETTVVVAVSKAGSTLETVAGFLLAEAWMARRLGARRAAERIAAVCGEERNALRSRAEAKGYVRFPVPATVGGRFSVLSAVGILPAALLGVRTADVLRGAAHGNARAEREALEENPALALAAVHHAALAAGRSVTVCLPYAEALRPFALWWEQLIGESLGKVSKTGPVGVTPLPGVGPSDQHSLLQLLIEGPDDKLVVFVEAESLRGRGPRVPKASGWASPAVGQPLGTILLAEREATEAALAERGRPSVTIRLKDLGPAPIGALLQSYLLAVTWWGWWMGIDPFGQPGVERGKVLTTAALTGSPPDAAAALARHRAVPRLVSR
jgi:glucose-6-phosphate isomerase